MPSSFDRDRASGTRLASARPSLSAQLTPSILACAVTALIGSSAMAQEVQGVTLSSVPEKEMPTVHVQGERTDARVYDRTEMDATPEGNRDLTSLISNHPAVRLDPSMSNSGNRGSLAPESFSVHGESPFQNQYLIDGISGTNSINPQSKQAGIPQVGNVPGFAQAYNVDTDLVDQVKVYDSRVPVEFGKFQGGVVDARIKTPTGSNKISIKRSFNSSNLTQQQVPDLDQEEWRNGEPGYSSAWKKHFTSMNGDFRLTEDTTALISLSRRESQIQRQARVLDPSAPILNGKNSTQEMRDSKDTVDNLMAKLHTNWGGGTSSSLLLKYSDRQENQVANGYGNTSWVNRQKAMGLAFDLNQQLASGKLTATFGVDQLDSARESDTNTFVIQNFADKSLSSYSSIGYGTESLEQRQYTGKLRMDWDAFKTGSVQHKVYAGAQLQSTDASFVRDQDAYSLVQTLQLNGTQKITTRNRYGAGSVGVDYNSMGLFVSDTMQLGNWALTAAARLERDDFLKNTNLSPRARLDWDVLGNGRTQLGLGWSRYYGQDMLGYALKQGKSALFSQQIQKGVEINKPGKIEYNSFDGVKTPHSDEWAFTASQQLSSDLEAGFSYVRRASRNGLTQNGSSDAGYYYANGASAKAETATISLRTLRPWKAAAAHWTGRVDFSWQNVVRNHDSTLGWESEEQAPDDFIVVNGVQMLRKDKPASGFHVPRKLSATINGRWAQAGVTWGNRLNWNSARTGIGFAGSPKGVDHFNSQRLSSYMTWDSSVTYQPHWAKGVTLSLDILNVLNKRVPLAVPMAGAYVNNARWQTGREIWLTAGYQF
ncbi:TonB-dependent receptor plug domain-containing protein [Comamonas sp. Y33R10-2]|uniref:TonB-dependent receptor plug domain-containing protein n=1 Tax=Comamonas sp. Y33R10-2 TaxID=2853257 RepID=UPI001C5CA138|nr:TonB-dependent receptor plug domain-containing protein [Comamonas sp. Y33R10-2]QXZ11173.1 TonB-dependent receptor plug domain-containing protein [Comamonas sp. Y33R10-2]